MDLTRKKQVLEQRDELLSVQTEYSDLASRIETPFVSMNSQIEEIKTRFDNAWGLEVAKLKALEEKVAEIEKNIRAIIVEEFESLPKDVQETERSILKPWLGVSVKKTFVITDGADHDEILEDVKEKYPTIITYDKEKLLKQAAVYTTAERAKLMPYIKQDEKVSATIKKDFWIKGVGYDESSE